MKLGQKIIIGALAGVTIGTFIELIFSAVNGNTYSAGVPQYLDGFANPLVGVLIARILYAVLGAIGAWAGTIYNNENRSLLASSALNLLVIAVSVFGIGWYLKWFTPGWPLVGFAVTFVVAYAIIWLVIYFHVKAVIRRANAQLEARQ